MKNRFVGFFRIDVIRVTSDHFGQFFRAHGMLCAGFPRVPRDARSVAMRSRATRALASIITRKYAPRLICSAGDDLFYHD
jgi:hypothetical protein